MITFTSTSNSLTHKEHNTVCLNTSGKLEDVESNLFGPHTYTNFPNAFFIILTHSAHRRNQLQLFGMSVQ
jgi:hypothetical protein